MPRPPRHLTPEQIQHFIDHHHIVLEDCFPREIADQWVGDAFARAGVVPDRPETHWNGHRCRDRVGVRGAAFAQDFAEAASEREVRLPKSVPAGKGTLGFRPESVTDRVAEGGSALNMKVDVVERLGSDQFLYGQVGSDAVTARVDPRMKVDPGDTVKLGLDTRTLHLFDATSELALI